MSFQFNWLLQAVVALLKCFVDNQSTAVKIIARFKSVLRICLLQFWQLRQVRFWSLLRTVCCIKCLHDSRDIFIWAFFKSVLYLSFMRLKNISFPFFIIQVLYSISLNLNLGVWINWSVYYLSCNNWRSILINQRLLDLFWRF